MLGIIKKIFIVLLGSSAIRSFLKSVAFNYKWPTKCVSLDNQPSQTRPKLININSDVTKWLQRDSSSQPLSLEINALLRLWVLL